LADQRACLLALWGLWRGLLADLRTALSLASASWRALRGHPAFGKHVPGAGGPTAPQRGFRASGAVRRGTPWRVLLAGFRTAKPRACSTEPSWRYPPRAPLGRAGAIRHAPPGPSWRYSPRPPSGQAGAIRASMALSAARHQDRAGAIRHASPGRAGAISRARQRGRAGAIRRAELGLSDARVPGPSWAPWMRAAPGPNWGYQQWLPPWCARQARDGAV
jgi:hypothetical protein